MRVRSFSLALLLSVGLGAAGAAPPADLPAAVAKDLKENADLCRDSGGTPDTSRAVTRVDLTADGKDDFVLFVGMIHCSAGASFYGDREKVLTVYVADGAGGAISAFRGAVYDMKIEGTGPTAKLWLGVSGGDCGKPPAPDFAHENFCDRALVWNPATKKFDYAPVSTVRMIQ
jgi:hypothetical protein